MTLRSYFHGSINGENVHYGTPRNPCAADRVPGGSSSGSAVAVGATLADFSLGKFLLSFFSSSPKFDGFPNPILSACLDHLYFFQVLILEEVWGFQLHTAESTASAPLTASSPHPESHQWLRASTQSVIGQDIQIHSFCFSRNIYDFLHLCWMDEKRLTN